MLLLIEALNFAFAADHGSAEIANMRTRVWRCRLLAKDVGDDYTRNILLQMAGEGQGDIDRLLAESANSWLIVNHAVGTVTRIADP
jgi:hypothetical protein